MTPYDTCTNCSIFAQPQKPHQNEGNKPWVKHPTGWMQVQVYDWLLLRIEHQTFWWNCDCVWRLFHRGHPLHICITSKPTRITVTPISKTPTAWVPVYPSYKSFHEPSDGSVWDIKHIMLMDDRTKQSRETHASCDGRESLCYIIMDGMAPSKPAAEATLCNCPLGLWEVTP